MEWILCEDRLPKNDDWKIITILDEHGDIPYRYSDFGWYFDTAKCWIVDAEPRTDVLAWMSLPLPYNADRKTENSSEKPNNCEHITEDGVTCAKYPACDDCLDNPLNKVKGSERLVKGSEQTEPTISKMEQVDKDINVRSKDEPQTADCPFDDDAIPCEWVCTEYGKCKYKPKDEPQPQTCSFSDCDNFKNPDYERCIECKRKQIKLKTEQTERSE